MKIVAHRGTPGMAQDNSRASIQLSIDCQVDVIEFDIRQTRDKQLVLHHDSQIEIDGVTKRVSALTVSELKAASVLTLDEAVMLIAKQSTELVIMLDCKGKDWQQVLAAYLHDFESRGMSSDRFIVVSFFSKELRKFRKLQHHVKTFYLYRSRPFLHLVIAKFSRVTGAGYYVTLGYMGSPPRIARLLRLQLYFYNVNTVEIAKKCEKAGIDYIGTDRASVIVPAFKNIELTIKVSRAKQIS